MKKPVIPVLHSGNSVVDQFGARVKEALDSQHGQGNNAKPLTKLAATATLADVITAYNNLLERVQGSAT